MPSYTRRAMLQLSAAVLPALALGCGRSFDPESVPESKERFPRTPIAGDMTQTRIVIAFHVADDSPVTLRIWTDLDTVVDQKIAPSGDGFHKVMISQGHDDRPLAAKRVSHLRRAEKPGASRPRFV